MNPQVARFNMIEQQIRTWQVLDKHVLALLDRLDRRMFVPDAYQSLAYSDIEIPIGHGEHMLAPKVDARLLQDLGLQAHENVLEIGTGTGYLTALLAMSCAHVTSVECHADFILWHASVLKKTASPIFIWPTVKAYLTMHKVHLLMPSCSAAPWRLFPRVYCNFSNRQDGCWLSLVKNQ